MGCSNFIMPFLMGRGKDGRPVSVSDHEGLYGEFLVERRIPTDKRTRGRVPTTTTRRLPPPPIENPQFSFSQKQQPHQVVVKKKKRPLPFRKYKIYKGPHSKRSTPPVPEYVTLATYTVGSGSEDFHAQLNQQNLAAVGGNHTTVEESWESLKLETKPFNATTTTFTAGVSNELKPVYSSSGGDDTHNRSNLDESATS